MGTLQINILGTSFTIKADEDSEYLNKLLRYYKGVTDTIEKKQTLTDPLQIAIMAGIMMCDQVYQDKKTKVKIQNAYENNTADSEADRITRELIEKIDKVLWLISGLTQAPARALSGNILRTMRKKITFR